MYNEEVAPLTVIILICIALVITCLVSFFFFRKKIYGEKKRLKWFLVAAGFSLLAMILSVIMLGIHYDDCCHGSNSNPILQVQPQGYSCGLCQNPFDYVYYIVNGLSIIGFVVSATLALRNNKKWYLFFVILIISAIIAIPLTSLIVMAIQNIELQESRIIHQKALAFLK